MTNAQKRLMEIIAEQERLPFRRKDKPIDHPVDDVNLMLSWSLGDISQNERDILIEHLADCAFCRRETDAMVREGVLVFSDTAAEDLGAEGKASPRSGFLAMVFRTLRNPRTRILITVAAVLMITVVGVWRLNPPRQSPQIAQILPPPAFEMLSLREIEVTNDERESHRLMPSGGGNATKGTGEPSHVSIPDEEPDAGEEIVDDIGNDPEKRFRQGKTLLEKGRFEEAIAIYEGLRQTWPDHAAILNALGIAYYMRDGYESEKAKEYFTKAKEMDPNNRQIRENLDIDNL